MASDTNTRWLNRRRFLQTGAATMPLLAGCAGGSGPDGDGGTTAGTDDSGGTTKSPDPTEVKIGYISSMAHAPLQKPNYTGAFQDANIDPTYRAVNGSSQLFSFLSSGELDVAGAAVGAAAHNAIARGLPVEVVAPLHAFPPDENASGPDPFLVSKESGITEISELKGETLGVNTPGSAITWVNHLVLQRAGLSINDVELRTMAFPDMIPAMSSGAIVGGVIPEPLATVAGKEVDVRRLAGNIRPGALMTATSFNTEWAEANPDAANRFMVEYLRGARDLQGNWTSDENVEMISDYMDVPGNLIRAAGKPYIAPNLYIDQEALTNLEMFLMEQNALTYDESISHEKKINVSYRDHALDELGKV